MIAFDEGDECEILSAGDGWPLIGAQVVDPSCQEGRWRVPSSFGDAKMRVCLSGCFCFHHEV